MDLTVRIESSREGIEVHRFSANGPFVIGRHESCRVRLRGDLVSRNHVIITAHDRGLKVRDVSSNGTRAGTLLLRKNETEIEHGTPIEVGDYRLVIEPDGPPGRRSRDSRSFDAPSETGRQTPLPPPEDEDAPVAADEETIKNELADGALRREIHRRLLDYLDLAKLDNKKLDDPSTRPRVLAALRTIIHGMSDQVPPRIDRDTLLGELADEALGLGPLERFLADPAVTEVMVVDANNIYVESGGRIRKMNARLPTTSACAPRSSAS